MSQRFLLNPHTRSLTNGCAYLLCVCVCEGVCITHNEPVGCGGVKARDGMCLFLIPGAGGHLVSK